MIDNYPHSLLFSVIRSNFIFTKLSTLRWSPNSSMGLLSECHGRSLHIRNVYDFFSFSLLISSSKSFLLINPLFSSRLIRAS